jgi:hypothetical protein
VFSKLTLSLNAGLFISLMEIGIFTKDLIESDCLASVRELFNFGEEGKSDNRS